MYGPVQCDEMVQGLLAGEALTWWAQSGARECKGSRPALHIYHTTVVLHPSGPAAVHTPSIGVYTFLDSGHRVWGYYSTIGGVYLHKV